MRFFPLFFRLVHQNCLIFGLSTESMDLWIHLRPLVRTFVPIFLKIRALKCFDFLYWKMKKKMSKKVTFSLFHRKFENGSFSARNGPKSAFLAQNAQKWGCLAFFSKTARWNFLFFCRKLSLCSPKNITALVFQRNLKNGPFWPKFTQIWSIFG